MTNLLSSILLISLFLALGLSAELMVRNIKYLAKVLKVRLFAFGLILGVITTLPEISIGLTAIKDGAGGIPVGNLFGDFIIMLSFILGISLILNRKIRTEGDWKLVLPQVAIMLLPLAFGFDGHFSRLEGVVMLAAYFSLIFYIFQAHRAAEPIKLSLIDRGKAARAIMFSIIGVIAIILLSGWIVDLSLEMMKHWQVSRLLVGLLIFAVGTNLPELAVAFSSWRRRTSELSLSHLLSSAFSSVMVFGLLSLVKPISFLTGPSYLVIGLSLVVILSLFLWFYLSGRKLDRREGIVLMACYFLFLIASLLVA